MRRFWYVYSLLVLMLVLSSCEESDVVAIRIRLNNDFSGTVTTSSLLIPQEGGPVERVSKGVAWKSRAGLLFSAGSFENLSALKIEDLTFSARVTPDGLYYVKVTLPRGSESRWPKVLTPASATERQQATESFGLTSKAKEIGSAIKLQIELPVPVVGHGVSPKPYGLTEVVEGARASLVVPVEVALTKGDPLVWHLTWQK